MSFGNPLIEILCDGPCCQKLLVVEMIEDSKGWYWPGDDVVADVLSDDGWVESGDERHLCPECDRLERSAVCSAMGL